MPALNDVTIQQLWRLTDTKKNLLKIEKLEMELDGEMMNEYSNRGRMGGSYDYGRDNYSNRMPIYGGSYYNGYSRTDAYSHLEAAMRDARNEQEREEIRQLMARYHN